MDFWSGSCVSEHGRLAQREYPPHLLVRNPGHRARLPAISSAARRNPQRLFYTATICPIPTFTRLLLPATPASLREGYRDSERQTSRRTFRHSCGASASQTIQKKLLPDCGSISSVPGVSAQVCLSVATAAGKSRCTLSRPSHHIRAAPSAPSGSSGDSNVAPASMAWAANRRSKGSSCPSGSCPLR